MTALRVPSLADDVVLLRPWRETDVPAQLEAFSNPFFQRFSDWAPHTEADARTYLAVHEQARQRGEQIELALVEPHDDNVVMYLDTQSPVLGRILGRHARQAAAPSPRARIRFSEMLPTPDQTWLAEHRGNRYAVTRLD